MSNNPLYWQTLAEAEYKIGNIMSSFEAYQEASQHDPCNPENLARLVAYLLRAGGV